MEQQKQPQKRDGNSGYLFKNANKRAEKQPDFRGKITIDGKEWLMSGWNRSKDGEEMISISLTDPATLPPREGAPAGQAARPAGASNAGGFAKSPTDAPVKAFQPAASANSKPADADDINDLENLFNGLDD